MERVLGLMLAAVLAVGSSAMAQGVTVTAHRGASGYLPELTLESFAMAYAQGVDYIEIDLVMSKDGALVILHDLTLEATTDVETVFPDRHRDDGRWHVIDFTLDEIRRLNVHERTGPDGEMVWPGRFPADLARFRVPTFGEFVELIHGLNRSTGRDVGLYVELKDPVLHAEYGLEMERTVLEELAPYPDTKIILQSFSIEALQILRHDLGTAHPLAFLVFSPQQVTPEALDRLLGWVNGVNPSKGLVEADPDLVRRVHERGMFVHVWTFRRDVLPATYPTVEQEIATFVLHHLVDGVITDHADVAVRVLIGLGLRAAAAPRLAATTRTIDPKRVTATTREPPPEDADDAPTANLVGTWKLEGDEHHFGLDADGTFCWGYGLAGLDAASSSDSGVFTLEDGVMTVISGDETRACRPGDAGTWRVRFEEEDTVFWTAIDDACLVRMGGAAGMRLVRLAED